MSIQFGRWRRYGQPMDSKYFAEVQSVLARYPSDDDQTYDDTEVHILYKSFETTKEGLHPPQTVGGTSGVIMTWDGRLDNRSELLAQLDMQAAASRSDSEIVLAAYERWGTNCFAKLLGDWALVLWRPAARTLLLAKDLIGTRQLYYSIEANDVTWCTVLDPLVMFSQSPLCVSEEYVAGYLAGSPATHLTPYTAIHVVPPSAFLQITPLAASVHRYESLRQTDSLRRLTDAEYEDGFRVSFRRAVLRRLRSSYPVIAELSGGMDSTAVVCVADTLLPAGPGETPRLDTLSYYDDEEPNWDERPFFSLIEKQRERSGVHIDCGHTAGMFESIPDEIFLALPGQNRASWDRQRALRPHFASASYRTLLSGIGGDEFLGGVPTPVPELQDLLWQFRWGNFARRLLDWSVQKRSPCLHLAGEVFRGFLPRKLRRVVEKPQSPPWLTKRFASRHAEVFGFDTPQLPGRGGLPSFQTNLCALDRLRRQLNCLHVDALCPYLRTFPYLDRDLLEFLFSVPREQLVRPGQRRSLMRRALAGIMPAEVLSRKRKAYVSRRPLLDLNSAFPQIERLFQNSALAAYGWIDRNEFSTALSAARHGQIDKISPVLAALRLEEWLQRSIRIGTLQNLGKIRARPDGNARTVAVPTAG